MLKHGLMGAACALAMLIGAPLAGAPALVSAAHAQAEVSFNVFFDRLSSNGVWVKSDRYDYVWCPSVDTDWMPYSRGHWIYLADRGWYFDSDEPFAWAVYHYGRWYRDTNIGWCWVPGDVWSPAWVTWRRGDDYLGWAPLQPEGQGYAVGTTVATADVPQEDWVFVPSRQFLAPQLSASIIIGNRQPDVFTRTQTVGPVVVQNNIVVNNVINVQFVEQQTGTKVQPVKAETTAQPQTTTNVTNNTIQVFNPTLHKPAANEAPKQAVAAIDAKQKLKAIPPAPTDNGPGSSTSSGNANASATNPPTPAPSGTPAPATNNAANSTTAPAAGAGAGAGAQANTANSDKGKPVTCSADEQLVNGKCQPAKRGQGGDTTTPAANTTTANPVTATDQTAPTKGQNPAATKPKPEKTTSAAPLTCAADEVAANGKCVPRKSASTNGHKASNDSSAPATTSDNGTTGPGENGKQHAGASTEPAANGTGKADSPKAGKPAVKCPAGEELVQGVCQPAGKPQKNSGDQPAQ